MVAAASDEVLLAGEQPASTRAVAARVAAIERVFNFREERKAVIFNVISNDEGGVCRQFRVVPGSAAVQTLSAEFIESFARTFV
jgi:hypothetical protein